MSEEEREEGKGSNMTYRKLPKYACGRRKNAPPKDTYKS